MSELDVAVQLAARMDVLAAQMGAGRQSAEEKQRMEATVGRGPGCGPGKSHVHYLSRLHNIGTPNVPHASLLLHAAEPILLLWRQRL